MWKISLTEKTSKLYRLMWAVFEVSLLYNEVILVCLGFLEIFKKETENTSY